MTVDFVDGEPYWVDVSARDVPAAAQFYSRLFGWEAHDLGEESGHYTMMSSQGREVCALGPCFGPDAVPAWTVYFQTSDPHATTKAVETAGGTVRTPPMDVFDQTTLAQFTDTAGANFAVSQPKGHKGSQCWGEPVSVSWVELHVPSAQSPLEFYKRVFGWSSRQMSMGEGGPEYTVLTAAGVDKSFGGLYSQLPAEAATVAPHWLVYFEVPDADACAAKAADLGGVVLAEPMTVPDIGRWAQVRDPEGAVFSVIASVH
ncbi:MAG: VOC family protein [Stackebrandtia sp.]